MAKIDRVTYSPVDYGSRAMDASHVSGFLEAQGNLIHTAKQRKTKTSFYDVFDTTLEILARKDNRHLLERLKVFFGAGSIYDDMGFYRGEAKNPMIRFWISDVESLRNKVVTLLDQFPFWGQKADVYQVWRMAVIIRFEDYGIAPIPRGPNLRRIAEELSRQKEFHGL